MEIIDEAEHNYIIYRKKNRIDYVNEQTGVVVFSGDDAKTIIQYE